MSVYSQTALNGRVQQAASRLIDTAHDCGDTLQRRRDRCLNGHIELATTNTMTDRGCRLLCLLEMASATITG